MWNLRKHRLRSYKRIAQGRPELFHNAPTAAAEILLQRREQRRVRATMQKIMRTAHLPPSHGDVGVLYEDQYIILLRDAVRFRSGLNGSYIRILPATPRPGAAILPICNGRIVMVRHFRHATRMWHWEIPRGFANQAETSMEAASRELTEELHTEVKQLEWIGKIHPDTGLLARGCPESR
ncbi:NUDIX hydrolase [Streptomyces griseoluteus]|uniref:NUDIX hydrolase n=1 Tax=Streptomyces griseoluteus TaxID=29306 RepID=UPI0036C167D1